MSVVMTTSMTIAASAIDGKEEPREEQQSNIRASSFSYDGTSGLLEATSEEMAKWANVEKPDYRVNETIRPLAASTWYQLSPMSDFYYYGQEKNNTCVSASSKMVLKFLTGTAYSESVIATAINNLGGTSSSNMATYLNSEQTENTYVAKYGASKTTMKNNLYSGIVNYNAPPVIGVQESTSKGWPYNLDAHAVVVYSVTSDKSEIAIADPWAGYVGDSTKWFDKTADDVYTAYNAINGGYIY